MEFIRELPEPESLLEEGWFFGNLLIDSKSNMSKSYSDLGPSDYNTREEMSVIKSEKSSSTTPVKDPNGENSDPRRLSRAPSLPSYMEPEVDMFQFHPLKEKHDTGGSNWITQNNLIREQSLPSCLKRKEEDEDEEGDFTLSRLIRQASLNSSNNLPPRHNSKTQNSGLTTKYRPRKGTDRSSMDMRDQYLSDGAKIRRSSSDIQTKEVESFKTLSHSPTIPNWCDNEKRSSQDMKAEIKFWARAVASNVAAPSLSIANRN